MIASDRVIGNDLCRNPQSTNAGTTEGAIILNSGLDYTVVTGNVMRGCSSGVTDSSGGSHNAIANNVGP